MARIHDTDYGIEGLSRGVCDLDHTCGHRRLWPRGVNPMRLLAALPPRCEADRFFRRAEQCARLVDAFLLLGGRGGIVDDAGARLDMHPPVFDDRSAQHDAGVHFAARAEIADAPGVDAALVLLEFV